MTTGIFEKRKNTSFLPILDHIVIVNHSQYRINRGCIASHRLITTHFDHRKSFKMKIEKIAYATDLRYSTMVPASDTSNGSGP
jgi:acetone carboxylase gamma subunit